MRMPQWAWELAREFRAEAGHLAMYPFELRRALVDAFYLAIEERPALTVGDVSRKLSRVGCVAPREKDRPLRACLIARGGGGWIFLNADDPPEEKAFSLAHEAAHFLRHHWQPRRRAAALGPSALAAFDGECQPTAIDQLRAA